MLPLQEILLLVGPLEDKDAPDAARDRFRTFLKNRVSRVAEIRDYIEECLRLRNDQSNRALQDLINHLGYLMHFEVTYGRYRGVVGQNGFDGLWKTKDGRMFIVVETKTTDQYTIDVQTLLGYIDNLVTTGHIPSRNDAIGLYVVARPDNQFDQLHNAIVAKGFHQILRTVSVDRLLGLCEMITDHDLQHEDMLRFLLPPGPNADELIDVVIRLVGAQSEEQSVNTAVTDEESPHSEAINTNTSDAKYVLTSMSVSDEQTIEETVDELIAHNRYIFSDNQYHRTNITVGDYIGFYGAGMGILGHARVQTAPTAHDDADVTTWHFNLSDVQLYQNNPVILTTDVRQQLDAFRGRDMSKSWAWFVQSTRVLTQHDFRTITRA